MICYLGRVSEPIAARVVTVSNRCASGEREDVSGALGERVLIAAGYTVTRALIPDGAAQVRMALGEAIASGARLIVTTGGTGVTPTDRTPEGTRGAIDRELPGLAELLRAEAVKKTPYGAITRGLVGVTDSTPGRPGALIVNLPGKPSAIADCLNAVFPAVPYCIDLIEGANLETDAEVCQAFRPAHAKKR